ncbi:unnamed protein product [Owenia fusiformis]|uniref:Uncharacterized protein n=1 Tax=Owenia fusiformis TaxID=6347 RepID=A0A8J1Y452_OWEFU|nr:unnamed protein product [Owenia fusiformis]
MILKDSYQDWINIGCNSTVLGWIHNGVNLIFQGKEPDEFLLENHQLTTIENQFVSQTVTDLCDRGILVKKCKKPRCVSPIGCVPKKKGKFRLITDLRYLNQHCKVPSFCYDSISNICDFI